MKRVASVLLLLIFTLAQVNHIFAQSANLKYYSSALDGDSSNDYSGVACALYMENSEIQRRKNEQNDPTFAKSIDKLSKNNSYLAWKALGEWDYKPGETYGIVCADSKWSSTFVFLIATISSDGKSFSWWGWAIFDYLK